MLTELPLWLLVFVGGRSSHLWWHKSQASLPDPPCAHGVAGSLHGEVRNKPSPPHHPHRIQSIVRGGWYPNWCPVSVDIIRELHSITCLHWREVKFCLQSIPHHESLVFIISNVIYVLDALYLLLRSSTPLTTKCLSATTPYGYKAKIDRCL